MERRSGTQRRQPTRFLKSGIRIGRRIEDLEFSLFLKMGLVTAVILIACLVFAMNIN